MNKRLLSLAAATAVATTSLQAETTVKSGATVLKFSGTHYLHFKHYDDGIDTTDKFGVTRNYLQVKAYFEDDPKSYMRVTLDAKQNNNFDSGSLDVRVKYAFLYLDNVFANTGVEIGLVHTPWLDFEEHHGWNYRAIGEVFSEQHNGGHLQTSSDYGINFKTKTEFFSSEVGIFNGEGYHGDEDGEGLREAWRLTAHIMGTGKEHVHKTTTYADVSFFGQIGQDEPKVGDADGDYAWYGIHAVYNQPAFLVAAQYIVADKADESRQGDGWSINGEYRINEKTNLIAKYDDYTLDTDIEKTTTIAGVGYQYNKYVEFIADYQLDTEDEQEDRKTFMLTAEVKW